MASRFPPLQLSWMAPDAGTLQLQEVNDFLRSLSEESDRSAVLISAARLESILESRLLRTFCHGPESIRKSLFSGQGALATFSAKIDVLAGLGLLREHTRNALHALRRLRNDCAHSWNSFVLDKSFSEVFMPQFGLKFEESFFATLNKQLEVEVQNDEWRQRFPARWRFEFVVFRLLIECDYHSGNGAYAGASD